MLFFLYLVSFVQYYVCEIQPCYSMFIQFSLQYSITYMNTPQFIYLFLHGQFSVWSYCEFSYCHKHSCPLFFIIFLSGLHLGVEFLGHRLGRCLPFIGTANQSSKVVMLIYNPPSSGQTSICSVSSSILANAYHYHFSHSVQATRESQFQCLVKLWLILIKGLTVFFQ